MANLSYTFIESNTLVSLNSNNEQYNISQIILKSTANNYVSIQSTDSNVSINASSNVYFLSNTVFNSNTSFNSNISLTTNNLILGTPNTSANGYSFLTNGLIMQWGTVTSNTTTGDVTFSIPFNTVLSFTSMATTVNSAFNHTYATVLIASNTTTANIRTGNTTSRSVTWLAVGI